MAETFAPSRLSDPIIQVSMTTVREGDTIFGGGTLRTRLFALTKGGMVYQATWTGAQPPAQENLTLTRLVCWKANPGHWNVLP